MSLAALPGLSFTAIDFETANPKRASVCAVGVVKVRDGVVVDTLETLVQPPPGHESFGSFNVAVHGLTAWDVTGAPTWDVVYPKIAEFAGEDALVAHNASFDRSGADAGERGARDIGAALAVAVHAAHGSAPAAILRSVRPSTPLNAVCSTS